MAHNLDGQDLVVCCLKPNANISPGQDRTHHSGGAARSHPTGPITTARSLMARAAKARRATPHFRLIVSGPIRGDSTTSMAMSGNGRRIAGTRKMPAIRETGRHERPATAVFAYCGALPLPMRRTRCVPQGECRSHLAAGLSRLVSVLRDPCGRKPRSYRGSCIDK